MPLGSVALTGCSESSADVTPKKTITGPGAGVQVAVGVAVPLRGGVGVGPPGQPSSASFTAVINSAMPTSPLPSVSYDGHVASPLLPSAMLTPSTSSLIATCTLSGGQS